MISSTFNWFFPFGFPFWSVVNRDEMPITEMGGVINRNMKENLKAGVSWNLAISKTFLRTYITKCIPKKSLQFTLHVWRITTYIMLTCCVSLSGVKRFSLSLQCYLSEIMLKIIKILKESEFQSFGAELGITLSRIDSRARKIYSKIVKLQQMSRKTNKQTTHT